MRTRTVIVAALALAATACAPQIRRFPLVEPVWQDADRNDVPEEPSEYYSGLIGDAADQTFFYPLARVWKFPLADDAANVNALDEVPDSAWFENRIGQHDLTPEEAAFIIGDSGSKVVVLTPALGSRLMPSLAELVDDDVRFMWVGDPDEGGVEGADDLMALADAVRRVGLGDGAPEPVQPPAVSRRKGHLAVLADPQDA